MNDALAVRPQEEVAAQPQSNLTLRDAWQAVVSGDMSSERLAVMKDLMAMNARQLFNKSFVTLLQELPTIPGCREIPDKAGNVKFRYANYEDIDAVVRPICLRNGFTYSFRETAYGEGRVTTTMTLRHEAGHEIEVPCTVRIGGGPPGTSEAQNDGGAHTYGKRNALEMGLSLRIVGQREDARIEGDTSKKVTPEQADEFERRAQLLDCAKSFLAFAKSTKFAEIPAHRYEELDGLLSRKERQAK